MQPLPLSPEHQPPSPRRRRPWRAWLVHLLRLSLVAGVLICIHRQHRLFMVRSASTAAWGAPIELVQPVLPGADHWGELDGRTGARTVLTQDGERLGFAIQTAPQANHLVGFSGPSNLLLVFDREGCIRHVEILSSGDTREHVSRVAADDQFLVSFQGLTWAEAAAGPDVDAVSGATLTSLTMLRGVVERLGGQQPNRLFPESPPVDWVRDVYPTANQLIATGTGNEYQVLNSTGDLLGIVLRTTPGADSISGYQGPTESLICFVPLPGEQVADHWETLAHWETLRVKRLIVGRSYDNSQYVGYVREDWSFPEVFNDLTLQELATVDLKERGIEGVSGATMTSMAVANSAIAIARQRLAPVKTQPASTVSAGIQWKLADVALVAVLLVVVGFGLSRWRGNSWGRLTVQLLVIVYLGVLNGALLSQAMFIGWAQSGVPWMSALGLVVLTSIAVATPTLARQNLYCSHLCPHGAVQQLLARQPWWKLKLGSLWHARLSLLPPLLLLWCLLVAIARLPFSLVDIEPFDAWLFQVAAWPTLAVAVVGLIVSLRVPMAYCQYGCPTGALLQYLRRHARSDELSRADLIAAVALAFAMIAVI